MRYKSYVATYAGNPQNVNRENYYLNGICKDNVEAAESFEENREFNRRNLYGVVSGTKNGDLGAELSYIVAGLMKDFFGAEFDDEYGSFFEFANSAINSHIFEAQNETIEMDVSAVYIKDDVAKVFNMGDVPVFFVEKGKIHKLTGDIPESVEIPKTYVDENGEIATEVIVKKTVPHLGFFDENCETAPYVSEPIKLKRKCYLVICSKAVVDALGEEKIAEIIADKKVSDRDKVTCIIDAAINVNPEGDFTVEVIAAKPGPAVGYADAVSLGRWVGVALICGILWLTGSSIAQGVSNLVDSTKTFIEKYIPEKESEDAGPRWVPWQKEEPEKAEEPEEEEEEPNQAEFPEENEPEQQKTTPKQQRPNAVKTPQTSQTHQTPQTSQTPQTPQVSEKPQRTEEEPSVNQVPQTPAESGSAVELPIDFN